MNNLLYIIICYSIAQLAESQCNEWQAYRDLKCFKIFESSGLQNYSDAINTCHNHSYDSNLITINSDEEQRFITNFIFTTNQVVDNVWIGAKYIDSQYQWNNGLNLTFTNWAEGYPKNTTDDCVQMHSDPGSVGKWVDGSCKRKNLVVCQKLQSWSMSHIQETIVMLQESVSFLKQTDVSLKETVTELKRNEALLKENVDNLKQNIVPIGFIYVQLPNEKTPKEIWPWMTWNEITSSYAGLFFRAEGGNSSSFGSTQEENAPQMTEHQSHIKNSSDTHYWSSRLSKGKWSNWVYTGNNNGTFNDSVDSRFFTSNEEVRPRNTAVRIWKRYG